MTTVGDVVALLEGWYEPGWAEDWDAVGLVLGAADRTVDRLHLAVDPTVAVAREAADADLLLTHHPLLLGGTTSVAAGPKAAVLQALGDRALYVAHTNADVAAPGVSDALGDLLGLTAMVPLVPQSDRLDRWVVHVPRTHTAAVASAMAAAGAGRLRAYDRAAFVVPGTGTFRPLPGARPYLGAVGEVESVEEDRLEMVAAPGLRRAVGAAVRAAHPYEVPSVTVAEVSAPTDRGLGRVGELPETLSLQAFCAQVAAVLPATATGVRAAGDPTAAVRTVAVAGGSCLDLASQAAAAGADVLVTSDAKHHRAQEAPLPVVDVAHWAGEWPWTAAVGERLRAAYPDIEVVVSTLVTDPWTVHAPGRGVSVS